MMNLKGGVNKRQWPISWRDQVKSGWWTSEMRFGHGTFRQQTCFIAGFCLAYLSAMKMEVHVCGAVRYINPHFYVSEEFVLHITACKVWSIGFMNLLWFFREFTQSFKVNAVLIPRNRLWPLPPTHTSVHHILMILRHVARVADPPLNK